MTSTPVGRPSTVKAAGDFKLSSGRIFKVLAAGELKIARRRSASKSMEKPACPFESVVSGVVDKIRSWAGLASSQESSAFGSRSMMDSLGAAVLSVFGP